MLLVEFIPEDLSRRGFLGAMGAGAVAAAVPDAAKAKAAPPAETVKPPAVTVAPVLGLSAHVE